MLAELRTCLPDMRVVTRPLGDDELPSALHDGQVDAVLGGESVGAVYGHEFVPVCDDPLVLLTSATGELAEAGRLDVADVLERAFPSAEGIPPAFAGPYSLDDHRTGEPARLQGAGRAAREAMTSAVADEGAVVATNATGFRVLPYPDIAAVPLRDGFRTFTLLASAPHIADAQKGLDGVLAERGLASA